MDNYEPNDALSFDYAHVIRLKFQRWTYIFETEVRARSNCQGLDNLDLALSNVWDSLPGDGTPEDHPILKMTDPKTGLELEVDYHTGLEEDGDLAKFLVAAEVVGLEKIDDASTQQAS